MPLLQKIIGAVILSYIVISGTGAVIGAINDSASFFTFNRAIATFIVATISVFIVFFVARYWGIKWKHERSGIVVIYRNLKWPIWIIYVSIIVLVWIGYFLNSSNEITVQPKKSYKPYSLNCNFPELYNRDTLYILVTRFEPDANKVETACFGRSLRDRIDLKINELKIPIKICYSDSLYPKTHTEAKEFQKKYFADLVLWGDVSNVMQDCSSGDFCFSSQPSDSLIKAIGGKIEVATNRIKFQQDISPKQIKEGNFYIDFVHKAYKFDKWLNTIYNIKIGNINPDLYVIEEELPNNEKTEDYLQRANIFLRLNNLSKALRDYNKAIDLL